MHDLIHWLATRLELPETPDTIKRLDDAYKHIEAGDKYSCLHSLTELIDEVEKSQPVPKKYQKEIDKVCQEATDLMEGSLNEKQTGGDPLTIGLGIGGGALALILIGLMIWGYRKWKRSPGKPGQPTISDEPVRQDGADPVIEMLENSEINRYYKEWDRETTIKHLNLPANKHEIVLRPASADAKSIVKNDITGIPKTGIPKNVVSYHLPNGEITHSFIYHFTDKYNREEAGFDNGNNFPNTYDLLKAYNIMPSPIQYGRLPSENPPQQWNDPARVDDLLQARRASPVEPDYRNEIRHHGNIY